MATPTPQQLGDFEIVREIGRGGMVIDGPSLNHVIQQMRDSASGQRSAVRGSPDVSRPRGLQCRYGGPEEVDGAT